MKELKHTLLVMFLTIGCLGMLGAYSDKSHTWIIHERIEDVATIERLTFYNADPKQTDSTPFLTAPQWVIDTVKLNTCELRWMAVSQRMIREGVVHYGDTVTLTANDPEIDGQWIIADCMASRWDYYGKTGRCGDLLFPMSKKTRGLWTNVKLTRHTIRIKLS